MKKTVLLTAVAAALTLSVVPAQAHEVGKCYGVAEKGKNDCGAKDGSHSCAGQAKTDHDKNDWKKHTKEDCDKAKGTWEAMMPAAAMPAMMPAAAMPAAEPAKK